MNCDDVFDALTDPALEQSFELDGHLANCPRCRQLKQVLEPARSLLGGDLPVERVPGAESPREPSHPAGPPRGLSVESVRLAEAIAAQLASSERGAATGGNSVVSRRSFTKRPVLVATLRSAALVLFGALAVYCLGPRERDSDSHPLPAIVPVGGPAKVCTRMDLSRKGQPAEDARRVILSCVGCHLSDPQQQRQTPSTSLFWPPRRGTRFSLAIRDAKRCMPLNNAGCAAQPAIA